jgi:acyl carrier protein
MNRTDFLALLAETIQTDAVLGEDTRLEDIEEWDSLAILTVVGLFKRSFQIHLTMDDIEACQSVADLMAKTNGKVES